MVVPPEDPQRTSHGSDRPVVDVETLASVLEHDFSLHIDDLKLVDPAKSGDSSAIYSGIYEGQSVIIKIGKAPQMFRVEVAGLELFGKYGIPAPRTLAHTDNSTLINKPIMVQTAAHGTALSQLPPDQQSGVWEDAGKTLKHIHTIPLQGFGNLDVTGGELRGMLPSWDGWIQKQLPYIEYIAEHGFIPPSETQQIQQMYAELARTTVHQVSFLHADFQGPHIFSDGQRVTSVIDLASALAGDPLYDVAYTHYFLSPEAQTAFDRGYGDEALDPMVAKYYLLVAVGKVRYRHKKGFTDRMPSALEKLAVSLSSHGIRTRSLS